MDHKELVDAVANAFAELCKEGLGEHIESLYVTGSYAFGKISLDRPDINFLIILKGRTTPKDYLTQGEICRQVINRFKEACSIRIEFRPFRYLYPKVRREYDVFLNPILTSVDEIRDMGCIFTKLFTEGLKNSNRLLDGSDFLRTLEIGEITMEDVIKGAMFDVPFFILPLTRAPAQYDESEIDLLFNEALVSGKMLSYLGIELALSEEELKRKAFITYIENKGTIVQFYNERYGIDIGGLVSKIYEARENYLEYKNRPEKAKELFEAALRLGGVIQGKLFSGWE